jgi:hypothetical protein
MTQQGVERMSFGERGQKVVQCARQFFPSHLDELMHLVQQDRQALYGWEEPAHLRATLRRAASEGPTVTGAAQMAVAETEFGREAGEPEPGEQREALGRLLQAGVSALAKILRDQPQDLSAEEVGGLECVLLLYGRPALQVSKGKFASVPPRWKALEDQRSEIELALRGVGRIDLLGHPEYDWAGTGFLVGETCLMTTRCTAELFAENTRSGQWQFRPGISSWMDYQSDTQHPASAAYRIRAVVGVHDRYNLALLEVEPPHLNGRSPAPLALAAQAAQPLEDRPVYMIGYPVRDARRNEPESIARVFRDVYNVKRLQPGTLRGIIQFRDVSLVQHDCAMLGRAAGSCLIDLETHKVLGLHLTGRYLGNGTAIPLWLLRDDTLLQKAGVTFAEATSQDLAAVTRQVERLARSHFWADTKGSIASLYERAFGTR